MTSALQKPEAEPTTRPPAELMECKRDPGDWIVGTVFHPPYGDGQITAAEFIGYRAKEDARAYADWLNSQ